MLLTKLEALTTALRWALAFLAVSGLMHAQVSGESYRNLVQNWLSDAKPLLTSITRANRDMVSAYSKLEHKLPGDARRLPAWVSFQQNQSKFESGFHALAQVLEKDIAVDERYLHQLNRSGGIEEDSVADNLRVRVGFQRSLAQACGQFVELLNQMGDGLRLLSQPLKDLPEFHQMMRIRDGISELLENSTKKTTARAGEYAAMNRNLVDASTSTYTIQFGEAGSLLLEYIISTRTEYGTFRNKIAGKITNTTTLPIDCTSIEPLSFGGTVSPLLTLTMRIPPGGAQPFSQEDVASMTNVRASGISTWKASCMTPLSYEFVEANTVKSFPGGTVTGAISRTQIGLTVENNSNEPIEIAWNDSSYIDMTRSAKRILHSGVKYADREQSLPNTVIPPLARVEDASVPAGNVYFVEGQNGGWRERPLLPDEITPDLAEKATISLRGAKVALFLQLLVNGKKTPVSLVFEVSAVKPGHLN